MRKAFFGIVAALSLLVACPSPAKPTTTETSVASADSKTTLTIPAGAITAGSVVTIQNATGLPALPNDLAYLGTAIRIEGNASLSQDATLSLEYDASATGLTPQISVNALVQLGVFRLVGNVWQFVGLGTIIGNRLSVLIREFGVYALMKRPVRLSVPNGVLNTDGIIDVSLCDKPRTVQLGTINSQNNPVANATYSISPNTGGVSISASGELNLGANASAGSTYTVTTTSSQGTSRTTIRVVACPYTVSVAPTNTNPAAPNEVCQGNQVQFTASASNNGNPLLGLVFSFLSANGVILTPNADGTFTATTTGTTSVSATVNIGPAQIQVTGSTTVTVKTCSVQISRIVVTPPDGIGSFCPGQSIAFSAQAFDKNDNPVNGNLSFAVSPSGNGVSINPNTGQLSVDSNASSGTYTITASGADKQGSLTITILPASDPACAKR